MVSAVLMLVRRRLLEAGRRLLLRSGQLVKKLRRTQPGTLKTSSNAEYATDLNVAQQQVLDKGTSTMVSSLRKRAGSHSSTAAGRGHIGQEVATKAYGGRLR